MKLMAIAFVLTLLAFLSHWIVWRIAIPRRQTASLLLIFAVVLLGGYTFCSLRSAKEAGWGLDSPWEYLHVGVCYIATMLGYVVAYSAIEERSPSMTILTWVSEAGGEGRAVEDVEMLFSESSPIKMRLQAMLRDGLIACRGQQYVLTAKGRKMALLFDWWARLMNSGRGG
jgi:hypothetical protein